MLYNILLSVYLWIKPLRPLVLPDSAAPRWPDPPSVVEPSLAIFPEQLAAQTGPRCYTIEGHCPNQIKHETNVQHRSSKQMTCWQSLIVPPALFYFYNNVRKSFNVFITQAWFLLFYSQIKFTSSYLIANSSSVLFHACVFFSFVVLNTLCLNNELRPGYVKYRPKWKLWPRTMKPGLVWPADVGNEQRVISFPVNYSAVISLENGQRNESSPTSCPSHFFALIVFLTIFSQVSPRVCNSATEPGGWENTDGEWPNRLRLDGGSGAAFALYSTWSN